MFDFLTLTTTVGIIGAQGCFISKIFFELCGYADNTIFMDLPNTKIKLGYELEFIIQETINIPLEINYKNETISKGDISSSNIITVKKREFTIKELAFAIEELKNLQFIFNYYLNCSPEKFINTIETKKTKELNLTNEQLKETNITGQTNNRYSLANILKAYNYLGKIKILGATLCIFSVLALLFQAMNCFHILRIELNAVFYILDVIILILDFIFLNLRGFSKVCHILHEFNDYYSKTNTSKIIWCFYF